MYSLKELYRIGLGPSSSHTIGPFRAGKIMCEKHPSINHFRATLLGSLAATGRGHFTDKSLEKAFEGKNLEIIWRDDIWPEQHPNGLILEAIDQDNNIIDTWKTFSVGGGTLVDEGASLKAGTHVYPHQYLKEITEYCKENDLTLWQYVEKFDSDDIWEFLEEIRIAMMNSIEAGLNYTSDYLPAPLKYARRAPKMYQKSLTEQNAVIRENGLVSSYALAASEHNASMGEVVTAPTCGACGVMPAILRYLQEIYHVDNQTIRKALAVAGILGLLAKHNASISGAEAGCQAEVGVACAMAAGAAAFIMGYDLNFIEKAAEIGLEHHLGLTCDPIGGYVLVPCIERNAVATIRALHAAYFAQLTGTEHLISYDEVIQTMIETGSDMAKAYRETSMGGLAKFYQKKLAETNSTNDYLSSPNFKENFC